MACQRESDNARRMRLGLEPVAQPYPFSVTPTSTANVFQQPSGTLLLNQNGNGGAVLQVSSASSDDDACIGDSNFDKSSSNAIEANNEHRNENEETDNQSGRDKREGSVSAGADDSAALNNTGSEEPNAKIVTCGASVIPSSPNNNGKAVTINIIILIIVDYILFIIKFV